MPFRLAHLNLGDDYSCTASTRIPRVNPCYSWAPEPALSGTASNPTFRLGTEGPYTDNTKTMILYDYVFVYITREPHRPARPAAPRSATAPLVPRDAQCAERACPQLRPMELRARDCYCPQTTRRRASAPCPETVTRESASAGKDSMRQALRSTAWTAGRVL